MRDIALLGSTGSIGTATLEVISAHPNRLKLVAMAAGRNRELFKIQCERFQPQYVALAEEKDAIWLASNLSYKPNVFYGASGLMTCTLHAGTNTLVAAMTGLANLTCVESALLAGQRVCIANKESLVVGSTIIRQALDNGDGELLPIDSEHCALHQLLANRPYVNINEVRITASGGPFLHWDLERIANATVEEALNHPTWRMGKKITIDSATLMNKGLEVIEASALFNLQAEQISVTIHPQSQVHAMVGFKDGTYQLQTCINDMKSPIQYTLLYPDCLPGPVPRYDWDVAHTWTFNPPDMLKFPCLSLAYSALREGGNAPIILNAANDEAVDAFLSGIIGFGQIQACVSEVLSKVSLGLACNLEQILDVDSYSRAVAKVWINKYHV